MYTVKRYISYGLLGCSLVGWFFTWRGKERVVPNLIVVADPQHYPDTVELGFWWLRGYRFHCMVVDKETKEVRPFLEHSLCRAEAQQQLMRYNEVAPVIPNKPIPHK